MKGHRGPAIAQELHVSEESLRHLISRMYAKFGIINDGMHSQSVRLVLLFHEQRDELGIRCKTCDSTCDLGVKCKAFWCDIGP